MCELSEENKAPLEALAAQLHDMFAKYYPREDVKPYFCDCQFGATVYFADIELTHSCCVRLPLRSGTEVGAMEAVLAGMRDWHESKAKR
jgi:hypothetical protein